MADSPGDQVEISVCSPFATGGEGWDLVARHREISARRPPAQPGLAWTPRRRDLDQLAPAISAIVRPQNCEGRETAGYFGENGDAGPQMVETRCAESLGG